MENLEEQQYLKLCSDVLEHGVLKNNRTGIDTYSLFGNMMRFSLEDNTYPLLTTKRVFFKGVAEELLWFIRGETDSKILSKKGVKIWDENGSIEFLKSRGINRREGDLGPVYGFNWRHFGAEYITCDTDYTGKGYDQLQEVINTLKNDPTDRRMIISAWNPLALKDMALPPCHMCCQFYSHENKLSCSMYQRSCDMGLGVPFNIASYSLLTILIASVTNHVPHEFVHFMGDYHVYMNHVEAIKEQMKRKPKAFPKLFLKNKRERIEDYILEDFCIEGYNPDKKIQMSMAI